MTTPSATTSKRVRRSQEDRRRETQASILDACVEVLSARGFTGLTTTEVAAQAGVSRGAQAHYYRTREDLIVAATRHLMETGTLQSLDAAEKARGAEDPVAHFVEDAESFFFGRTYVAMMELLIAARTQPAFGREYVAVVRKWRSRVNRIWLEVFREAGISDARANQILHFTNNLMRGLALTSLWDGNRKLRKEVLGNWRAVVTTLAREGNGRD